MNCGPQLVADLFAFPCGRVGERDAGMGDHSSDELCHRLDGDVVTVDAGIDEGL